MDFYRTEYGRAVLTRAEKYFARFSVARATAPQRFRIQSFLLHPSHDQIGLTFDSMFDWGEEHGCAVLVSEGKVREGDWGGDVDVLSSFYDELSDDGDA